MERTYQGIIHQKITGERKEQKSVVTSFESSFRFSKNRFYQISFIKSPLNGKKVAVKEEEKGTPTRRRFGPAFGGLVTAEAAVGQLVTNGAEIKRKEEKERKSGLEHS